MTEVANQPAALDADSVRRGGFDVSDFRHSCLQSWEISARITRQGQGVPEPSVDFQKDRHLVCAETKLDHGNAVPVQGVQHGETAFANLCRRQDALAERAARSRGMHVSNAAVGKLSAKLTTIHKSKISGASALNELLDEHSGTATAHFRERAY